ncbi:proline-rich protein PRCC [Iris pallida]|uniref:Proline-rich protein PRCC n=1 Tax=Iris pallida TaxID=29817 RepID=A0AAX6EJ80_IRIPA|nr:proline-rich protein PRCC [Iris pallida]
MDSLLANYASSDEEEEAAAPAKSSSNKPKPSFFSTLPPPKTSSSSSTFSSLPPPKSQHHREQQPPPPPPKSATSKPQSSLFSHLPPPKSQPSSKDQTPNPKRLVQFTLPFDPSLLRSNHPDDDDDGIGRKQPIIEDNSSSSSFSKALSSMLPAPKNSLCLAPKKTHVPNPERIETKQERTDLEHERSRIGGQGGSHGGGDQAAQFETHLSNPGTTAEDQERSNFVSHYDANWVAQPETQNQEWSQFGDHGGYPVEDYGSYGGSSYEGGGGDYVGNWNDGSSAGATTGIVAPDVPELGRIAWKRGRNEIPTEMLEVKQDELMKNRPRADQAKLTGIAFGPAYQPVSTSKGKPSKLHKRKHQIGSLFFDMKQKEMELAERRAKGFLTKAETQAKYGW